MSEHSTSHEIHHDHGPVVARKIDALELSSHGKVGMWFFLATDGLTFSGFLLAYGILRARNPEWPNPEDFLGIALAVIATSVLILSSVTMVLALAAGEEKRKKEMIRYLALTAFGGMCFLGIQVYEYTHLVHEMGMTLTEFVKGPPQFASTFFVITGFHGFHVFCGVVYLLVILGRAIKGKYDSGNCNEIEIAGLFWHFVDLVWILVFTLIYLIPKF